MNCNEVRENLMDVLAEGQPAPEVLAHLREWSLFTGTRWAAQNHGAAR
jgi:hypothetical protein